MRISDWSSDVCSSDLSTCGSIVRGARFSVPAFAAGGAATVSPGTASGLVTLQSRQACFGVAAYKTLPSTSRTSVIRYGSIMKPPLAPRYSRHFPRREYRGAQCHCPIVRQAITWQAEARTQGGSGVGKEGVRTGRYRG